MPLVGGFPRGSPVFPVLAFRRSVLASLRPHRALKTSIYQFCRSPDYSRFSRRVYEVSPVGEEGGKSEAGSRVVGPATRKPQVALPPPPTPRGVRGSTPTPLLIGLTRVSLAVQHADESIAGIKEREKRDIPEKKKIPVDQRYHPVLFPHAKIRERYRRESNPVLQGGMRVVYPLHCRSPGPLRGNGPYCTDYGCTLHWLLGWIVIHQSEPLDTMLARRQPDQCGISHNVQQPIRPTARSHSLARPMRNPTVSPLAFHQGDPGSIPGRVTPVTTGFLGDMPFPPPFHSGAAPYPVQSPSSALDISMLRAVHISSPTHSLLLVFGNGTLYQQTSVDAVTRHSIVPTPLAGGRIWPCPSHPDTSPGVIQFRHVHQDANLQIDCQWENIDCFEYRLHERTPPSNSTPTTPETRPAPPVPRRSIGTKRRAV
ncbi:hypothetical protein PR048_030518 [Dryococelus australis]|uniref:Uncharacterized protein n=1 Tax=Dryococelus australis TaxID=614101 RepID=A0ABQ9GBW8_9NEOP|nr:hypothetical protein PR048_030518 [Dryococelus australis]